MARQIISDSIWEQLQRVMKEHGCQRWRNDQSVMEAILWKLRTGAPWRDIPETFCPWKTAYNKFNRWASKGLWDNFFLHYEESLIQNGYSQTEVTYALINMRVELGVEKNVPLDTREAAQQQRFILPPTRMEIRSILKSLGVKSTIPKLQVHSLKK